MNSMSKIRFKSNTLNCVINKILIKISLNTTNKSSYPLSLNLLREEIQKVIIVSVLVQCSIVFSSLSRTCPQNINNRFLIDIILRVLLLSSKQQIAYRLALIKYKQFAKLTFSEVWLIKNIELQESNLIVAILRCLKFSPTKKSSLILTESLIENLTIKLSDIVLYDLFYEPKISTIFFIEYSIDFVVFKDKIQKLQLYLYLKKLFDQKDVFLKKTYKSGHSIIICSKDGLISKNLHSIFLH